MAGTEKSDDTRTIAESQEAADVLASNGNPATHQPEKNLPLGAARVACSVAVLLAFGCVIFIGGHGIGAGFMLFMPPAGSRVDVQTCLAWGVASVAMISHAQSSPKIGAIARLLAFGTLAAIGLWLAIGWVRSNPRSQPITLITSIPFLFFLTLELVVDVRLLCKRSQRAGAYTFTIRDIFLATAAASGFVLPAVLF